MLFGIIFLSEKGHSFGPLVRLKVRRSSKKDTVFEYFVVFRYVCFDYLFQVIAKYFFIRVETRSKWQKQLQPTKGQLIQTISTRHLTIIGVFHMIIMMIKL